MVGPHTLDVVIQVRILAGQPGADQVRTILANPL
jgi:hypothetical protein